MDKNTVIGFVLIAAVLIGFTYFNSKSSDGNGQKSQVEQQAKNNYEQTTDADNVYNRDSIINQDTKSQNAADTFFGTVKDDKLNTANDTTNSVNHSTQEQIVYLENDKIKIEFSSLGGQMLNAELKKYKKFDVDSLPLRLFDKDSEFYLQLRNRQGKVLQTKDLNFSPFIIEKDSVKSLVMRYSFSSTQYIDFKYTLSSDDYMLKFDVALVGLEDMLERESSDYFELNWAQKLRRQEKSITNEQKYSAIYYKYVGDEVVDLSTKSNDQKEASEAPTKWIAFKDQYFSSILIADNEFKTIDLSSKMLKSEDYLKSYFAKMYAAVTFDSQNNSIKAGFRFYLGPLEFTKLKGYDDNISDASKQLDLDKLVPLGWTLFRWVNKYFVIPIFNLLGSTGMSMGLVILLLTIIVKLIISPLTYKSFMSSAKMRVLRPQIEELAAKYPKQEQAMEKQQATMALYSKAGVNPMSGCIPLIMQMPILIALFQFFPTAIELRQQSFLWASDLSTYDAIKEWSHSLPLIGNHISLFCVLMTVTNIIYTKFNMEMTNTGQQQMPGMKWMMYLMPLIFLFVLNDYPSGLTYYYFLSLLITIVLTLLFRFIVDEEKLLAKLEANKSKKKKKSGFMARLQEAQRLQQQQLNERNKKGGKRK